MIEDGGELSAEALDLVVAERDAGKLRDVAYVVGGEFQGGTSRAIRGGNRTLTIWAK